MTLSTPSELRFKRNLHKIKRRSKSIKLINKNLKYIVFLQKSINFLLREIILAVQSQVHKHSALLKENQGMVILDAMIDDINTPVCFVKDMSTVELLTVIMKAARFNKVCARTFRVDNSIQGPFTSSATLNMFSELVKDIIKFNEKATNLQIQQVMANYPLEGKIFCYLRLVATDCKLMISAEQDSLHKSLRYLTNKRNDNPASRGNNRNSRGSRRARPY